MHHILVETSTIFAYRYMNIPPHCIIIYISMIHMCVRVCACAVCVWGGIVLLTRPWAQAVNQLIHYICMYIKFEGSSQSGRWSWRWRSSGPGASRRLEFCLKINEYYIIILLGLKFHFKIYQNGRWSWRWRSRVIQNRSCLCYDLEKYFSKCLFFKEILFKVSFLF